MRNLPSTLTLFATLLLVAAAGCGDDEGSHRGGRPGTGGSSPSGGSKGSTAGATSMPNAGTANQGGETGTGIIPTEACMGLPIDLSADGQGGAPAAAGGASGDAGGEAAGGAAAEPEP